MKINESTPPRKIINCNGTVIVVGGFNAKDCLAKN